MPAGMSRSLAVQVSSLIGSQRLAALCWSSQRRCWGPSEQRATHSHSAAGNGDLVMATAASAQVWERVVARYDEAQACSAASTTETRVELVRDEEHGVTFVLRIAAALRDKPKAPAEGKAKREWRNPFLPYDEDLWVQHLSGTHTLLLNKFNIVAHHVLVVTRGFEAQEDPLNEADFSATWTALLAPPGGALAFYNCGPMSGASQPHKHVQLVPLPIWEGLAVDEVGDTTFAGKILACSAGSPAWAAHELRSLPFASFVARLPAADEECSPAALAAAYSGLLQRCADFVRRRGAPLSYNMVLTRSFMMLVPRRQEADGPVSCNSVAFAGSFFVRSAEELAYVRCTGPMSILSSVGYLWGD